MHKSDFDHRYQSGEATRTFQTFLHDHEIGDECRPNLYLDGVVTLSIEVSRWGNLSPDHRAAVQ